MTVALLDGDIIAYRAACVGQEEDPFGQPGDLEYNPKKAHETAEAVIRHWIKGTQADSAVVVFSGPDCFRYAILPTYKHSRKGEKPKLYGEVVARIEQNWKVIRKDHLEADDTIGILASKDPARYVAVSIDKDFATIPGRIFNPDVDAIPRTIKPAMADRAWLMQTLTGDTVDGYKGCPGIGKVKATRILDEAGMRTPGMWAAVLQTFLDKGLTLDDAVTQARVARILRHTDFDTETREIILWHPKTPQRISPAALVGVVAASASALSDTSPETASTTVIATEAPSSDSPSKPSKAASKPRKRKKSTASVKADR